MRTHVRGHLAFVLFVALGLLLAGAPAAGATGTATAVGTGTVSGTVTGTGAPLAGVTVRAVRAFTGQVVQTAVTAGDGSYHLAAVPTGLIKVSFTKAGWLPAYAIGRSTFWSATVFAMWTGRHLTVPRQDMTAEAVVEGQVLSWMDPVDATVSILDADTGRVLASARTTDCNYRIGGLHAGRIKVRASEPGYRTAYADGGATFASGATYELHAGQVLAQQWTPEVLLYLDMTPGGTVWGSVLGLSDDPVYGWDDPLPGVTVTALDRSTGRPVASTKSDPAGNYELRVEPYLPVHIRFTAPGWVTSYAPNASSWSTAGTYTLEPITAIPLGVQDVYSRPAIQGQVLSWMDPLGYARVTVYDAVTGWRLATTVADGSGYYRIAGLPVRPVKVGATKLGYQPSFANGRSTLATADVFVLQPGHTLQQQWSPMVLYLDLAPAT